MRTRRARTFPLAALALASACSDPVEPRSSTLTNVEPNADVSVSAVAPWEITVLPLLPGGTWAQATGINDGGMIVGYGDVASGAVHAFSYKNGVMTDLNPKTYANTWALGVNANGEVVGRANTPQRPRSNTAVIWNAAGKLSLLPGTDTVGGSIAYAINAGGTVVGKFRTKNGDWHAARWMFGRLEDYTPTIYPGLDTEARAINNAGVAVGFGDIATVHSVHTGLKFDAAKNITYVFPLFGSGYAADSSRVYDINNSGKWIGWSSYPTNAATEAYISSEFLEFYPPNGLIGEPETALSDRLRMVGTTLSGARRRAFTSRWLADFGPYGDVLPIPLPYMGSGGADVNACGRVVGWMQKLHSTDRRAVLWTRYVTGRPGRVYPCDPG